MSEAEAIYCGESKKPVCPFPFGLETWLMAPGLELGTTGFGATVLSPTMIGLLSFGSKPPVLSKPSMLTESEPYVSTEPPKFERILPLEDGPPVLNETSLLSIPFTLESRGVAVPVRKRSARILKRFNRMMNNDVEVNLRHLMYGTDDRKTRRTKRKMNSALYFHPRLFSSLRSRD